MKNNKIQGIKMEIEDINLENLYSVAKKQTPETIGEFVNKVMSMEGMNYDTVVHCVAACALAGAAAANNHKENGGITGFQAGYVMWLFIRNYLYEDNKCGLKMVDFDDMLYPQHKEHFEKVITKDVWENLQKEATHELEEYGNGMWPERKKHLQKIVDGVAPFGYSVKND